MSASNNSSAGAGNKDNGLSAAERAQAHLPGGPMAAIQTRLNTMFPGMLGLELVEVSPERIVGRMRVGERMCTAGGSLHGGASMAFADTLGAVGTVVNLPEGATTTTTDSNTKFLAGAPMGSYVTGESTPFHRGRTTMVWQTLIRNEAGKLCAVVTQTQLVMQPGAQSKAALAQKAAGATPVAGTPPAD